MAIHFNADNHDMYKHLKIIIAEGSFKNGISRKNKEAYYINKLETLPPVVMNISSGNLHKRL